MKYWKSAVCDLNNYQENSCSRNHYHWLCRSVQGRGDWLTIILNTGLLNRLGLSDSLSFETMYLNSAKRHIMRRTIFTFCLISHKLLDVIFFSVLRIFFFRFRTIKDVLNMDKHPRHRVLWEGIPWQKAVENIALKLTCQRY